MNRLAPSVRLMRMVAVSTPDACWRWTGGMGSWGYGSFWLNGANMNSSRAAYLLLVGPIADGLVVCHACDNPACCNPSHLFLGTQGDNVRDCNRKGRGNGQFPPGDAHPRHFAKLTATNVTEAKALYASGVTQTEIARRLKVSSSRISRLVRA